ncbi:hypothetical protein ACQJBY_062201 [Aegilops geniculata]
MMALAKTIALLVCLLGTAGGTSGANCIPRPRSATFTPRSAASIFTARTPPPMVDWRAHGAVTPVMDQGVLGSCWAISTAGAIEGLHKIRSGRLVRLSSQQIYDCSNKSMIESHLRAYDWVLRNRGVASEETYPYVDRVQDCKREKLHMISASITSFVWTIRTEQELLLAVAQQPVTVKMSVEPASFLSYTGGIFSGPCGHAGHSMLAVGYGALAGGRKYWILKGSYGVHWGDHGYFYVQRGPGHDAGLCGIANYAAHPV